MQGCARFTGARRCGASVPAARRGPTKPNLRRGVALRAKKQIELMNRERAVKVSIFEEVLKLREVESWPTWECEASTFPWTYEQSEECYLTEGEVTVTPDNGEAVSLKAGDFVTFPKGMSCVWDVKAPVKKHYNYF
mmetsp:Transcript_13086/g.32887  ORF Transcript_13086/g.32887 Transcript_13086/m.32887 type:complete len:136 (+) Transcript_13086:99-506(+)